MPVAYSVGASRGARCRAPAEDGDRVLATWPKHLGEMPDLAQENTEMPCGKLCIPVCRVSPILEIRQ